MTQRLSTMSFPDSWVAPGGKVDPQETFLQAAVREIEEEVGLEITAESLQPILFYESTSEIMHEGVEKAKSQIFVMFYMCNLNPATSPKYGSLAPHELPVKVQASEVQAFEWVHEDTFLSLLTLTPETADSLKSQHGEDKVRNFGGIHPNPHGRGVPEGHYLAFLRYCRDR